MYSTKIISFEGIIGAGKSTTIKYISEYLLKLGYSVYVINENIDEWVSDGILQKFYENPKRYSYHFQTKVFMDKVKTFCDAYNKYWNKVDFIITERSLVSDFIFASILHNDGMMDDMEFKHYNQWYNMWKTMIPNEFLNCFTIYIKVDCTTAMQRVTERSRSGENNISEEYQSKLINLHDKYFNSSIIVWNGTKNIHDEYNVTELIKLILLI